MTSPFTVNGDIYLCFGFNEGNRALFGLLIEAFSSVFFEENVRYPVWTYRGPISFILGTRFSLILPDSGP